MNTEQIKRIEKSAPLKSLNNQDLILHYVESLSDIIEWAMAESSIYLLSY
jgi:hypothetical protein